MSSQSGLCCLIPRAEIQAAVGRLAAEISRDYHGGCPLLVGVLKGSFVFMADLIRLLDFTLELDFIKLSSYGKSTQTCGEITVAQGLCAPVGGRDVLVIEDIVDTGLTTAFVLDYLCRQQATSVRLCALLDKPSRRNTCR